MKELEFNFKLDWLPMNERTWRYKSCTETLTSASLTSNCIFLSRDPWATPSSGNSIRDNCVSVCPLFLLEADIYHNDDDKRVKYRKTKFLFFFFLSWESEWIFVTERTRSILVRLTRVIMMMTPNSYDSHYYYTYTSSIYMISSLTSPENMRCTARYGSKNLPSLLCFFFSSVLAWDTHTHLISFHLRITLSG